MLNNILNSLFGVGGNKVKQTPVSQKNLESAREEPFCQLQLSLDEEVEALAKELGGIATGMELQIDLHRLLDICPRKRRKADAYLGLKKKLRDDFGVELVITLRTSKNGD